MPSITNKWCALPVMDEGGCEPLPVIPIPLEPATPEPELPLNTLVHDLYDRARLDLRVDYAAALSPTLAAEDAEWVAALLQR